jgi:hypothetical protein
VRHVDIQPPNDIYDTFGRLNYKPWYALAEFVDNSTQNFFDHEPKLAITDGEALLDIDIQHNERERTLTITDNAHGMGWDELQRALRVSARPPNASGRSEFGMGMKTAACWFGSRWTVRTTRLGEARAYRVVFDIDELKATQQPMLDVAEESEAPLAHGTIITIEKIRKPIKGRQVEKVRELLTSMYRRDLDSGKVQITWNENVLQYTAPDLWQFKREDGSSAEARQPIDLTIVDPATGDGHRVTGWVGLLGTMSSGKLNGFDLLRRGRLIIGGPSEQWRPSELCGASGSHEWKRLVGELELDDFPVNFTKDGFAWDGGLEDALISALAPLMTNYRNFARNLRVRDDGQATAGDFRRAVTEMQEGVRDQSFRREVAMAATPPAPGVPKPHAVVTTTDADLVPERLTVPTPMGEIKATLYVKAEGIERPWLSIQSIQNDDLDVLLNLDHPFVAVATQDERGRTLVGKVALSLAVAEQVARLVEGDVVAADSVRMYLNTFLAHSGSA